MLSPRDDEDDDSHLCIKCNATIVGLDNYVKHRKEKCGKKAKPELPAIDPLEPSYSLGADVFFQSLELQSSVKKTSLARLSPPVALTKAGDRKATVAVPSTSRDIPRMSPLDSNLRGEYWIGGHSLRIGSISNEDNQTKLINAVASISGAVKSTYSIPYNDYKADDDSEESDDLEDEDDDEVHAGGGKWKPPPNYTGGKWRPASPEQEVWGMRDEQEHTGGKWKPIMPDANERDEDFDAPPPGHTKGKWIPGAADKTQIMQTTIQSKGAVQYWCGPCNRRLGSKAIYDKHLMSSLHMRKVLPEHELEFSGHLEPLKSASEKRAAKPSRYVDDSIYIQSPRKTSKRKTTEHSDSNEEKNVKIQKKKRKRKPYFVHCSGCKSRVRLQLMGKHLISHYHFRKTTDTRSESYDKLICDNIEAIVHQSPFQCSPCKFYTNWASNFLHHWYSEEHESKVIAIEGRCWCSFCKFECDTSEEMMKHITGNEHSEVVAAINRSMPIIIRKKSIIQCETCQQEFRYNIEMKKHCQVTGHTMSFTGTSFYQDSHHCRHCKAVFKTSVSLVAHLKSNHKQRAYMCQVCEKNFDTAAEAKKHRYTAEHKIRRKEKMQEKGLPVKDMRRKCPYCTDKVILKNVLELKDHIRKVHPKLKRKCPKCGMTFTLPQEVTVHVRSNACQFPKPPLNASILWNCSQCLYTTDSQAECFFHEALHTKPMNQVYSDGDKEKVIPKYNCPICPKKFPKASLRYHLKQHTFERPYVCLICGANFTRQGSLANHHKLEHGSQVKEPELAVDPEETDAISCGQCKKSFSNRPAYNRHRPICKLSKEHRCQHEECSYTTSNPARLARHYTKHVAKCYECLHCQFKTKQASHMKRHMRCHEGIKPYLCPHCDFTCGSLENLRKHVLRSGRHKGLWLYRCRLCAYETNMAKELRLHLTKEHSDKYDSKTAMVAVNTHLMKK